MCMTHNGGAGPMSGPSMKDSYRATSASGGHHAGDGHNHSSDYSSPRAAYSSRANKEYN